MSHLYVSEARSITLHDEMNESNRVRAGGGWANEELCYDSHAKVTLVNARTRELLWKSDSLFMITTVTDSLLCFGQTQRYL